jgi:hypothetical protein
MPPAFGGSGSHSAGLSSGMVSGFGEGKLELSQMVDEPLTDKMEGSISDSCTLKIDGMTCGACVEVRDYVGNGVMCVWCAEWACWCV